MTLPLDTELLVAWSTATSKPADSRASFAALSVEPTTLGTLRLEGPVETVIVIVAPFSAVPVLDWEMT